MATFEKMYIDSIDGDLVPGEMALVYAEDQKTHQMSANFLPIYTIDTQPVVVTRFTAALGRCAYNGWYNTSQKTGELSIRRADNEGTALASAPTVQLFPAQDFRDYLIDDVWPATA